MLWVMHMVVPDDAVKDPISCSSEDIGAFLTRVLELPDQDAITSHSMKATTLAWKVVSFQRCLFLAGWGLFFGRLSRP